MQNTNKKKIECKEFDTVENPYKNSKYGCRRENNIKAIREGIADLHYGSFLGSTLLIKFKDREYGEKIRQKQIKYFDGLVIKYYITIIDLNKKDRYALMKDGTIGKFDTFTGIGLNKTLLFDSADEANNYLKRLNRQVESGEYNPEDHKETFCYYLYSHPEEKDRYRIGIFDIELDKNLVLQYQMKEFASKKTE